MRVMEEDCEGARRGTKDKAMGRDVSLHVVRWRGQNTRSKWVSRELIPKATECETRMM